MRKIIEHGMSERQSHVWQYRRPTCPASHSSKPVQVPLEEFAPALLLLMIGTVSSASILLVEYCVKRRTLDSNLMGNHATDDEKQASESYHTLHMTSNEAAKYSYLDILKF